MTARKIDLWLAFAVTLYVANAAGWAAYMIWRIFHG